MAKYKELSPEGRTSGRSSYGQYGLAEYGDNVVVPYLSYNAADQLVNPGETFSDFSHGRGNYSKELGWTSNSFSNALSQGASAFGIKKYDDPFYGPQFTGDLNKVAQYLGIDPSAYKEAKEVPVLTQDSYDEYGRFVPGGQQMMNYDEYTGKQVPVTRFVSPEEQLYNAINEKGADYFSYTGDSLMPGAATEGGANSFQTVLYKREGDVLKPISAPVSHGGWQNADVYTGGSGFNFGRDLLPGLTFVGGAALGMYGLDQLLGAGAAAALGGGSAGSGFVGLDAATAAQLGLSGGSGLGTAGASGNVLAGIYGAEGALGSGFAGLTPEYAAELGLQGTSGLGIEGASGDVLAGIPTGSTGAKDALTATNRARALANALTGGQTNGQQMGMNMPNVNMPAFEQFGGLYRSNQNPFLVPQQAQVAPLQQTKNFLQELSEQGKPNELASLLRNA